LPSPIYQFLIGGAEDERSVRANEGAFADYDLLPAVLNDVSSVDTSVELLGRKVSAPLILSPTGANELFHHDGESGAARAAARAGIFHCLSVMSTTTLEDVAASADGPRILQIYVFKDRGVTRSIIERARLAGYDALCLTVDTPVGGNRERDLRSGLTMPPRLTAQSMLSFMARPAWVLTTGRTGRFVAANFDGEIEDDVPGQSQVQRVNALLDPSVTWQDAEWLAAEWGGRFLIKGILSPADAKRAAEIGAEAILISNHGGRQLESTPAPFVQLPGIRDAVGDGLALIVDGGIRRGTDIVKALALGASACSIGRPYLYGLSAYGEEGCDRAIEILRTELERNMTLLGCPTIAAIGSGHVQPARHIARRP
jgi:L-lactate dehydrogenase (cytochrome)